MSEERALTIDFTKKSMGEVNDGDILLVGAGCKATSTDNLTLTAGTGGGIRIEGSLTILNSAYSGTGETSTLEFERGTGTNAGIRWSEGDSAMQINNGDGSWLDIGTGSSLLGYTQTGTPWGTVLGSGTVGSGVGGSIHRTVVGFGAGASMVTADDCTIIGYQAADGLSTANRNTVIGAGAAGNLNASENVIIGSDTLLSSSTTTQSVIIGHNTAGDLTGGNANVFVGYKAQKGANSVTGNVAVGFQAGELASGGTSVTIGYNAGRNQTGGKVTIVGYSAASNTVGEANVAIGEIALQGVSGATAQHCVAVGYGALQVIANSGNDNVAVGYSAGAALASGASNVLVGTSAGASATTAASCVLVGHQAGSAIAVGALGIVSLGFQAGQNGVGDGLISIGYQAGQNAVSQNSIFIGTFAGQNVNVGGNRNIGIGTSSLQGNATYLSGVDNVGVGFETLVDISSAVGNVGIGSTAGKGVTTGGSNLFAGHWAAPTLTTGSNNVYLGASITPSAVGVSDEIVIGQGLTGQGTNTTSIKSANVYFGTGIAEDFHIVAYNDFANKPYLLYDDTLEKWRATDDGTTLYDLNSGGGGGVTIYADYTAAAAAVPTDGDICWVQSTMTMYQAVPLALSGNDNQTTIDTSGAGNQRWVATAGQHAHALTYRGVTTFSGSTTNTRLGYGAMGWNLTDKWYCTGSTYIGYNTGASLTSAGANNTIVGSGAFSNSTGGGSTVAIGQLAARDLGSTYSFNTYVGTQVAYQKTQGQYNTAVGMFSMADGNTSDNHACLGYETGRYATGDNNVYVGYQAGKGNVAGSSASWNVALGFGAISAVTTGGFNCVMGTYAGRYLTTSASNIIIGYTALAHTSQTTGINNCVIIGDNACNANGSPWQYTVAIGTSAMQGSTGVACIGIGYQAGNGLGAAVNAVALGYNAGYLKMGTESTVLGSQAGTNSDGTQCTYVGFRAGTITGNETVCIGADSGYQTTASTIQCTFVGRSAGYQGIGTGSAYIGYQTGYRSDSGGDYNVAMGYQAHYGASTYLSASYNIALGYRALYLVSSGSRNVSLGDATLDACTTGSDNVAISSASLSALTTGSNNIAIGRNALNDLDTENGHIAIGVGAMAAAITNIGDGSVAIGYNALAVGNGFGVNGHCRENVAIGYQAMAAVVATATDQENDDNVAVGYNAMYQTPGAGSRRNVAIGSGTLGTNVAVSQNVAVGYLALDVCTADSNTAVGNSAGGTVSSGDSNVFLGASAGAGVTSGSNNTILGAGSGNLYPTTGSYNNILGYNVNLNSADSGGTGMTAIGYNFTAQAALTTGDIQLGDYTGDNVYCWSVIQGSSDRRLKRDIQDLKQGLSFINELRPVQYKFKDRENEGRKQSRKHVREHYGLIAQEVKDVLDKRDLDFGGYVDLGHDKGDQDAMKSIRYEEFISPLIKAVQELSLQVDSLKAKVASLEATNPQGRR